MNKRATLHFFCGKMAAGKSTLAKKLAEDENAVLISEDAWLLHLYPQEIATIADYLKYASRLRPLLFEHVRSLLANNVSVVMDFPANTTTQRNWFRTLFEQSEIAHVLHFIDVSDDVCKAQLKQRSSDKPEDAPFTSEAEFNAITQYFQPPCEDEGFTIRIYRRNRKDSHETLAPCT